MLEAPVDVYLTASPFRGEEASIVSLEELNPQEIVYFGGQDAAQLIAQFAVLYQANRSERQYEAVIVITDGTGYELGESSEQVSVPPYPVWMVHVGGALPLGYDDQTQEAIQASGGGVTGSLDEALSRIAVSIQARRAADEGKAPLVDLVDGYLWTVLPSAEAAAWIPEGAPVTVHADSDPFAALAARRIILAEMQRNRGVIDQVETLDALHGLAMHYQIVTPYSSMIVLVNFQQEKLLEHLSNLEDRYEREVEGLGDTTPGSPLPLAGVPEPHEWLLIGLAVAFLLYMGYQRYGRLAGGRRMAL
jgi:putative PEP-CTERM system integral membrane protein